MNQEPTLDGEGAVIKFLLENPGSSGQQIFDATGVGVVRVDHRFLISSTIDGVTLWAVDHRKFVKWLRNKMPDAPTEHSHD